MSDPTPETRDEPPRQNPGGGLAPTRLRVVVWILGGGFAIYLIVTGIVGILTKAR